MYRTDFGMAMGGNVAYCKFTIGFQDLTSFAALAQQIALVWNTLSANPAQFTIPQGGVMLGVRIHPTVPFAGTGVTGMTLSVGTAASGTFFAPAFNVFQAASNTTLQETSLFASGSAVAVPVFATFTATGANLALLTAGSVDVYLYWLNVSTPNA